jgi:hypothetical protein
LNVIEKRESAARLLSSVPGLLPSNSRESPLAGVASPDQFVFPPTLAPGVIHIANPREVRGQHAIFKLLGIQASASGDGGKTLSQTSSKSAATRMERILGLQEF